MRQAEKDMHARTVREQLGRQLPQGIATIAAIAAVLALAAYGVLQLLR